MEEWVACRGRLPGGGASGLIPETLVGVSQVTSQPALQVWQLPRWPAVPPFPSAHGCMLAPQTSCLPADHEAWEVMKPPHIHSQKCRADNAPHRGGPATWDEGCWTHLCPFLAQVNVLRCPVNGFSEEGQEGKHLASPPVSHPRVSLLVPPPPARVPQSCSMESPLLDKGKIQKPLLPDSAFWRIPCFL